MSIYMSRHKHQHCCKYLDFTVACHWNMWCRAKEKYDHCHEKQKHHKYKHAYGKKFYNIGNASFDYQSLRY